MKFIDAFDTARPYLAGFVLLREGDKVAMVLRKDTGWMDGYYGLPAGKVEYDETFLQAVAREAEEEAGVKIKQEDLKVVHVMHRHGLQGDGFIDWIDIYFEASAWEGEPANVEPEKSESLDWVDIKNVSVKIVPPQLAAIKEIMAGNIYSEYGWTT